MTIFELFQVPAQLKDLLDTTLSWDFDIFRLEELTNKRPLVHIGMNLFNHFDICSVLNCDEKTVLNWLTVIENHYHVENSYHNSTHAADVLQVNIKRKSRKKVICSFLFYFRLLLDFWRRNAWRRSWSLWMRLRAWLRQSPTTSTTPENPARSFATPIITLRFCTMISVSSSRTTPHWHLNWH